MQKWIKTLLPLAMSFVRGEINSLEKRAIKELSSMISHGFSYLVGLAFCAIALLLLSFACVVALEDFTGSLLCSLIIMGAMNVVLIFIVTPICRRWSKRSLSRYFFKILNKGG
ncbi:MAG: hypothetical protein R3Y38_04235 [Rikenellaceae bacterium]